MSDEDDMAVEYRPIPEDYRAEFDRITGYAFSPEDGPGAGDDGDGQPDDDGVDTEADGDGDTEADEGEDSGADGELSERRGIFDGEELLAVCKHYLFDARVRGTGVGLAGMGAVASPPESRREGHVGRLIEESLAEYRDRGCEFAALWPFERSFYARYGWATANLLAEVECAPEDLAFADRDRSGEFRRLSADEWRTADRAYREHASGYGLSIDRWEAWWRNRIFGGENYVYAYERGGDPAGYLVYRVEDGDDGRRLEVYESVHADAAAFRNLLRFAYYHDSQVETVHLWGPHGELRDLLEWVPDPGNLEYELSTGPMVRVVDVARALSTIPYPTDGERLSGPTDPNAESPVGPTDPRSASPVEATDPRPKLTDTADPHPSFDARDAETRAELAVEVTDPHAAWNEGTFLLSVEDGEGTCERADGREADLRVGIGPLSQAVVGYRQVERLRRDGAVEVRTDGAARALSALLPSEPVYLRDFF